MTPACTIVYAVVYVQICINNQYAQIGINNQYAQYTHEHICSKIWNTGLNSKFRVQQVINN